MWHWSQLATRNWRVKRVRTAGALLAIALGVGAVVWVTCCYESVRQTVMQWAGAYVGKSHINVESPFGRFTQFALRRVEDIERLPEVQVVAPLLIQRLRGKAMRRADYDPGQRYDPWVNPEVDYYGIDLATEPAVRDHPIVAGRMLRPDDRLACVLEDSYAQDTGIGLGDWLVMWNESGQDQYAFEVVGLTSRRRIARFQPPAALVRLPVLQEINNKAGFVTAVDIVLRDGSPPAIARLTQEIRRIVQENNVGANVRDALARLRRLEEAQQQQDVVLALLSCVAMLTALFIILSTLSMGMLERIAQLGLLRCVGTTGRQLAGLVFLEVIPLGVLGIVLGIPVGLGLTWLTVWLVPEYVGAFTIAWDGILLAAGAGLATAVLAACLPALGALRVSPLEALRPRARPARRILLLIVLLLAAGLLVLQIYVITHLVRRDRYFMDWSALSVILLYAVYALAAPLAIWVLSAPAVHLVARLIGVRARLLQDQVGHAVWRSAGICCGLMVGLSLIVALVVFNDSFKAGWQFPKEFPEAYIWSFEQLNVTPRQAAERIAQFPDVREFTVANALNVIVDEGPPTGLSRALRSITWFMGIEPGDSDVAPGREKSFFDLVKLQFVEGDEQTARLLLGHGGYVLVASDFARTRRKAMQPDPARGITNTVQVWFGDQNARTFRIAGVVDSPALDIAASFFQAETEARVVAVGSVIGSNADLKRYFNIDSIKLALLNLELPPEPPPPDWPPPRHSPQAAGFTDFLYDAAVPVERRWQRYRADQVLRKISLALDAPQAYAGTARALKDQIDAEMSRVNLILTAIPAVALLVAAIGVANLMTANVASRTRQLAILRAVGATRGQVLRMVVGEALILGVLGSALGLALGVHLARDVILMTVTFWGLQAPLLIPWRFVGLAVALTIALCILAGILPARHASRTNVIEALRVA